MSIKRIRTEQNFSRRDAANQLNIAYKTLIGWESGYRHPSYKQIRALAKVLGVTDSEIIDCLLEQDRVK
ncbi:MAG: helix-turn-helix domain-containing protein, partial [Christensenellaceae bacterium]|nr:helix-turn-helix domain-containing protein [Christensenellaceae bacterium]